MTKKLSLVLIINLTSITAHQIYDLPSAAEQIPLENLFIPKRIGELEVYYDNSDFIIKSQSNLYKVQRCFMDEKLRGIPSSLLDKMLCKGSYLCINKMEDHNDYSIKLSVGINFNKNTPKEEVPTKLGMIKRILNLFSGFIQPSE